MSDIVIDIYGSTSKLSGDFPKGLVREVTSYPVEGAKFSPTYKKGLWDGRKHLFKATSNTFPTGLIPQVVEACGGDVTINDHRVIPTPQGGTYDLVGVSMTGKYAYQLEAVKAAIAAKQGILQLATGSGKTECACAITKYLGLPTLFVVGSRELLYQAHSRFVKRLGASEGQIGMVGDGIWEPGSWVTVATVGTLEARINTQECQDLLKATEVLFVDEAHHAGAETWYDVCTLCTAGYRYGLSGTPLDRTDGANLRLLGTIGDVIYTVSNKFLVENGISARAEIIFSKVTEPVIKKKTPYPTAYKQGVSDNPNMLSLVVDWVKIFHAQGLGCLVLCEEIAHGKAIDEALWTATDGQFIPHVFIHGSETAEVRANTLKDFAEGRLPVMLASSILDEGVDVPTIDALIVAGSRKSTIKTMQRLGRGLRGKKLIVIEFSNFCHDFLLRHSLQRYEDYKKEDCFPIHQSAPNAELVKRLWNAQSK